ncbi:MAG: 5-(carboxyamino)imidazole ribonucleotide mutase [Lachnospiraceae bacterium]|nr:5-(carboxyamino)imidazole ribonucleotide mutase [Lachnospiraceae bacterium]
MAKVGIVMGSDSDIEVMSKAAEILDGFDIEYDMQIISAHREPDELMEWCRSAGDSGIRVMIAGAGMAAALPGMCAALFEGPVIGVPLSSKVLDGKDALYSILQMPPGVPVATVAINGAKNAGLLAAQILAASDDGEGLRIREKLASYKAEMKEGVKKKNERLQEKGYRDYLEDRK